MNTIFVFGLAAGLAALLWSSARAAAETAAAHGRRSCRLANVQWLDQSVHLVRLRLRRGHDGRLGLERHYRFEYSRDGDDRHAGRVVLLGRHLQTLTGPLPPTALAQEQPRPES